MLDKACWYLNESSRHEECEYGIVIMIHMNQGIVGSGTQRVKPTWYCDLVCTYFSVVQKCPSTNTLCKCVHKCMF